jgi:flagellin-like protein
MGKRDIKNKKNQGFFYPSFFPKTRKGVSPVVATSLLIAMVIVIALILYLWFKGISGEACTKFEGRNVELVCADVQFFADYNPGTNELYISNSGNVPIFGMKVKIERDGSSEIKDINDISSNWPALGLNQGGTYTSEDLSGEFSDVLSIILTPALMGTCGDEGEKVYACNEDKYGYEISIS